MKRELILIRHTKSSWADFSLPDFDRPLKKDRTDDAKNMAKQLKKLKVKPNLILCSPAKRTKQTAEYFCLHPDCTLPIACCKKFECQSKHSHVRIR